jgi:hypothetical protein
MRKPGPLGGTGPKKIGLEASSLPVVPPTIKRRQQPERAIQIALIEHLHWRAPPDVWWSHFPAGGRRNVIDGAILKRMGTRPGTPDLLIIARGKIFGLELKADRGRLSPTQIAAHNEMRRAGAVVGVAGTIDEAISLLGEWGCCDETPRESPQESRRRARPCAYPMLARSKQTSYRWN